MFENALKPYLFLLSFVKINKAIGEVNQQRCLLIYNIQGNRYTSSTNPLNRLGAHMHILMHSLRMKENMNYSQLSESTTKESDLMLLILRDIFKDTLYCKPAN